MTHDELVARFRELRRTSLPHGMTFVPCKLNEQERRDVEKELDKSFKFWWDSWIAPLIDEIEKDFTKKEVTDASQPVPGCPGSTSADDFVCHPGACDTPQTLREGRKVGDDDLEAIKAVVGRLENWKFMSAYSYWTDVSEKARALLKSEDDEDVEEILKALAETYGNCGWISEGNAAMLIGVAVGNLLARIEKCCGQ